MANGVVRGRRRGWRVLDLPPPCGVWGPTAWAMASDPVVVPDSRRLHLHPPSASPSPRADQLGALGATWAGGSGQDGQGNADGPGGRRSE